MSRHWMLGIGLAVLAGALIGCGPKPTVEFTNPRIMMHLDTSHIVDITTIHGDAKGVKLDDKGKFWQVTGVGKVQIELPPNMTNVYMVDVANDKIRLNGVEVKSQGALRDVYFEPGLMPEAVHPDRVK